MDKKKKVNKKNTPIRERILSTAVNLFYRHGIQAVGVDKIVAEARVAKMTLYSYFPSKDDLIKEYLEVSSEKWLTDFHAYLNKHCSNDQDRLLKSFEYLKLIYNSQENFRGISFINAELEISDPSDSVHGIILEFQENIRESFENWAYNSGLKDARDLSYSLLLVFEGAVVAAMTEDFPEPIGHAIKTAQTLINCSK